jgi:hypothetical protein
MLLRKPIPYLSGFAHVIQFFTKAGGKKTSQNGKKCTGMAENFAGSDIFCNIVLQ